MQYWTEDCKFKYKWTLYSYLKIYGDLSKNPVFSTKCLIEGNNNYLTANRSVNYFITLLLTDLLFILWLLMTINSPMSNFRLNWNMHTTTRYNLKFFFYMQDTEKYASWSNWVKKKNSEIKVEENFSEGILFLIKLRIMFLFLYLAL